MGRNDIRLATLVAATLALSSPAFAADQATAVLMDPDGKEVGKVTITAVPSGVLLDVDLTAMPPGTHAFHIHETGKCEPPDFASAGGHFNPEEDKHGLMNPAGPHAGDMPNIHVPESGQLRIEVHNQMVNLELGLFDDDGSAIVIHEGADDYISDPAGHAGARLACGVVTE
ncbi:MAG: superoxide dismutase family protein [Methyloceanibacter sp.]|uniref:superoxide dismutase family protein n=1 Tax=Methyloceanibacter sp. TaxID=1965321 RepID=UPI003D6C79AD